MRLGYPCYISMKIIIAVDGNSIMNRAFYGVHSTLSNNEGFPTNALYGMLKMLFKLREEYKPDAWVAAFDVHAPTFRHQIYDGYKAGRHETPAELLMQFPVAHEILEAMGFTILEKAGYEADDFLGTVAEMGKAAGDVHTYIYTGDKDSLQLIRDSVTVLLATNAGTVPYTPESFFAEKHVRPEQFVDVKAIMGDSSDNIPGVPGIGEKTAFPLIEQFGSLDALYEALPNATDLKPGVIKKLTEGRDSAYASRDLSQIETRVPCEKGIKDFLEARPDREKEKVLFKKYGFGSFLLKLDETSEPKPESLRESSEPVPEIEDISEDALNSVSNNTIIGISLEDETLFAAFDGRLYRIYACDVPASFFRAERKLVISDCKSFYHAADRIGMPHGKAFFDPMLAAYVLNSGSGKYQIPDLVDEYLNTKCDTTLPEAYYAVRLYEVLLERLKKTGEEKLLFDIEMPLSTVLYEMEKTGFQIDRASISAFEEKLRSDEERLENECYALAGMTFNLNSPKQLGEVLFEKMYLPCDKKSKKGYSTSAEVLEKLRPYSPIIDKILEYRTISKLRSTYAVGLLKEADENGRVHTTFRQTGTATGRLSSAEPNLQNIPIRTDLGRAFRKFFVPLEKDRVLIDADYSQIELRLLANISGDEHMISAFHSDVDIHTATASRVFGVPESEVTPELRKRAKAVNFGILYGIGPHSLSEDLHITMGQAKAFIENYKAAYPVMTAYLDTVIQKAREDGFVKTIFGRRRMIPELSSQNKILQKFGERVAMNSPIQGSAADLIKIAMIHVFERLKGEGLDAKLILQVHDELILDASRKDAEKALEILKEEMENVLDMPVKCIVEANIGKTWYECH